MFGEIVGHGPTTRLLEKSIVRGTPGHAYLLLGPAHVGKRAIAISMARALACQSLPESRPCGMCVSCRLHASGGHPDYRLIDRFTEADEKRARAPKNIPIEAVRKIQHDASLSSHLGGFKVYIIANAEELSLPAMDALLKTLEEPAPHVVLILTCTDVGLLPATIISRCQVLKLGLVAPAVIAADLMNRFKCDHDRADLIAHFANGRPGEAIELASGVKALDNRRAILDDVSVLDRSTRTERLKHAERFSQDHTRHPETTQRRLEQLLIWWRDVLLVQSGCEELVVNRDRLDRLRGYSQSVSIAQAHSALRSIEQTVQYLSENVQPRLALELLSLSLPRTAS